MNVLYDIGIGSLVRPT